MGSYQKFKGDPENKLFYILNGFAGGINTEFSDDASSDVDFESIINFDVDKLGTLNKRNGFGELNALSDIFARLGQSFPECYLRTKENPNVISGSRYLVYAKLLKNDNNCFKNLAEFNSIDEYRKKYGFQFNSFTLLLITSAIADDKENDFNEESMHSEAWYYSCRLTPLSYDENGEIIDDLELEHYWTLLPVTFNWNRALTNMDSIEFYSNIWFTNNDKGLVRFDRNVQVHSDEQLKEAFSYTAVIDGVENEAYKPSLVELTGENFGPNSLCTNPLYDLKIDKTLHESIQGAYLTTVDFKPIYDVIPVGEPLLLYILYTGNDSFNISAKNGEADLKIITEDRLDLSTENIKVVKLSFENSPNGEVEFKIEKVDVNVLKPFYFYVNTGQLDPNSSQVEHLNIGDCRMCMMSDNRVAYYKEDVIFFSDTNYPNYITFNNYLKLPLEPTDSITKMCYFKGVYIIFTKEKIYKITGNWLSPDFSLEPVNMSLGCHAGHTVVPIDDMLYFMSPRGLYALKSSTFIESLQNVKELDIKVKKLTSDFTMYNEKYEGLTVRYNNISEKAYALRYRDKYMLFYNSYGEESIYANSKDLDVLVYQYDSGVFTTYRFEDKPTFIAEFDGKLDVFTTIDSEYEVPYFKVFEFGVSPTDFNKPMYVELETKGINMGYPQHLKKLKHIFVKMMGGYEYNEFLFELYGDGYIVNNPRRYYATVEDDGTVSYNYDVEKILDVDASSSRLGTFRLGETRLGDGTYQTKKLVIPSKAKNFKCKIYGESSDYISFESFGFVSKLGKVKEG